MTALLAVIRRQQQKPGFFSGKGDLYCGCIEGAYMMQPVGNVRVNELPLLGRGVRNHRSNENKISHRRVVWQSR